MPIAWNLTVRRLQPLPALRGGGDMDAAGHVHADRLAGFGFDLFQEVDRIGLENRHVGVGVERVKAAGRVPRRARGQDRTFHQRYVAPPVLRKVVKNGRSNDAPANYDDAIVRFHPRAPVANHLWTKAIGPLGARLDNDVQLGSAGVYFVGKCGFCRLVGGGRICVWMAAVCVDRNAWIRAPNPPPPRLEDVTTDSKLFLEGRRRSAMRGREGRQAGISLCSREFSETRRV